MNTRRLILLSWAVLARLAAAQTCIYTADTDPVGPLPIGSNSPELLLPSGANYVRTQVLLPLIPFQNVPYVINEIAVGTRRGVRVTRFGELTIRMGHTTVAQLTPNFAANITSPLVDVLVARDHIWTEGVGPGWVPLGLQRPFQILPGSGQLLVEIIQRNTTILQNVLYNGLGTGSFGEVIVGFGASLPTTSSSGPLLVPPRLRLCVDRAETMLLGTTCAGSGTSTPLLGVSGRPTPGASSTIWLSDAPANAVAGCAFGFDNASPYPIDLTALGARGCMQYFAIAFADVVRADAVGIAQRTLAVPNASNVVGAILYAQYYVLDPPANALGLTASNYARLSIGW